VIRYTHVCSGAGRFSDTKNPPSRDDARMHGPHGWESFREVESCLECNDDAPLRGCYNVVVLRGG
jgi:hypothetical protein